MLQSLQFVSSPGAGQRFRGTIAGIAFSRLFAAIPLSGPRNRTRRRDGTQPATIV